MENQQNHTAGNSSGQRIPFLQQINYNKLRDGKGTYRLKGLGHLGNNHKVWSFFGSWAKQAMEKKGHLRDSRKYEHQPDIWSY